ncbi:MAG: glycosyltransferase family 4 protein [Pseudorhodoplanes sp.]|nr:glycosyltransferase family 4 protein [Pseudorhodoplanes sp.]
MVALAQPLKILHVFRAPVGGLFRHVIDLVRGQSAYGHQVGIVADSLTGGESADRAFAALAPHLKLGASRVPMGRGLGLGDITAARAVAAAIARLAPDVVHGHGAKGAAYARLAAIPRNAIRVYTPHGGSLHYRPDSIAGLVYITLEKILKSRTDLFLFESEYIRDLFNQRVGAPRALVKVVRNGVADDEFAEVAPAPSATDLLYIGELRTLKGVSVLVDAIAELRASGQALTATIVGDGPDRDALLAQVKERNISDLVQFRPPMPAHEAFALGRVMVVPSFGESLPYIVLEAGAAAKPLIATNVGGIPEIFGPQAGRLVRPGDRAALMRALGEAVNDPETIRASALAVQARIREVFSIKAMVDAGLAAYAEALRVKCGKV